MKIGTVDLYNVKTNRAQINNARTNYAHNVSFCANDTFERAVPSQNELLKKLSRLQDEIVPLVKEHKKSTGDIIKKAAELQNDGVKKERVFTFKLFSMIRNMPDMLAVNEVYEQLTDTMNFWYLRRGKADCDSCCSLLTSANKQLADDILDLYPFFMKAKWGNGAAASNCTIFCDMLQKGFRYNPVVVAKPQGKSGQEYIDAYQNNLIDALEASEADFKKTGKYTVIIADDMQSLVDKTINSAENIAAMKEYTNTAGDDGAAILYSLDSSKMGDVDKGILQPHRTAKQVNLDEFEITQKTVDTLKKARRELAPKIEQLDEIYSQLTKEDYERLLKINKLAYDYLCTGQDLAKLYPKCIPNAQQTIENAFLALTDINTSDETYSAFQEIYRVAERLQEINKPIQETAEQMAEELPQKTKNIFKNKPVIFLIAGGVVAAGAFAFLKFKNKKADTIKTQNLTQNTPKTSAMAQGPAVLNKISQNTMPKMQSMDEFLKASQAM